MACAKAGTVFSPGMIVTGNRNSSAVRAVIAYAEEHVFSTRTGHGGIVSQDVRGVVAAGFDHWDSRAGDPQLHTHVVMLNRVQAASDGGWRTLECLRRGLLRHGGATR